MSIVEILLANARGVVWIAFAFYLTFVIRMFLVDLGKVEDVMQQNAVTSMSMFWVVAGYTGARALDSILRLR
jgi:hypothetical protein